MEMTWKEPPPTVSSKYAPALAELKKNPGRWALVQEKASSSGSYAPWKKLGCETQTHRINPGETPPRYEVYARWPEPKKPGSPPAPSYGAVAKASGGSTYDPGLGRASRGIPEDGLPVESLRR